MSKKAKIYSVIFLSLIGIIGVLGFKYSELKEEVYIHKLEAVSNIRNSIIHLLDNTEIDEESEKFIQGKLWRELNKLSPEYNVEDNTKEEVDEWTRISWRMENINFGEVEADKKKTFLDKYKVAVPQIGIDYEEQAVKSGVSLKVFLNDVASLYSE